MFRSHLFMFAPFALILAAAPAVADDTKAGPPTAEFVTATLKDDRLNYQVTRTVTVTEYVSQQQEQEGKTVTVKVPVQKQVQKKTILSRPLSELKATGTNGMEISPGQLRELVKPNTPVVLLNGPLAEEWRLLFKTGTVFFEPAK